MPAVSRDRIDKARTGHKCTSSIGCEATARTVFINNRKVLRKADKLLAHNILRKCGKTFCCVNHKAKIKRGSNSVFAEGRPIARERVTRPTLEKCLEAHLTYLQVRHEY